LNRIEETIEALITEVQNLNRELAIAKKLYNQEHTARLAIASELENAQKTIKRLNFYLENT
jgi:archaellum component FlaC